MKLLAFAAYLLICALLLGRGLEAYQDRTLFEPGTPSYIALSTQIYGFGFVALMLGIFLVRILRAPGPKDTRRKRR